MQFVDANNVPYTPTKYLSFDDVMLMPLPSNIPSRLDPRINISSAITEGYNLNTPIIAANMDSVTEFPMVKAMAEVGAAAILHRFYKSADSFMADIKSIIDLTGVPSFSIGAKENEGDIVEAVVKISPRPPIVCVDVAHGHLKIVVQQVERIKKRFGDKVQIIAGNVCTPMGVMDLVRAGANGIKVGVGGGSQCKTRLVTGFGLPQFTAIMQCRHALSSMKSNAKLIADGGIRTSGDIVKALAAGADSVMIGGLLSATIESPAEEREEDRGLGLAPRIWKKYRGQASQDFLDEIGRSDVAPEGESEWLECQGSVKTVMNQLIMGLRSGMTYANAYTLSDLYKNAIFVEITQNGYIESTAHGKRSS